ncbi:MAG: MFS transporter [Verrucomicrobia subdivision 3 bacterium]|nr:MFS transporter [Limisphaerales bacterium]
MNSEPAIEEFPPGLNNAYLFAVFNALSFQFVLSSPMILYAKSLGASATVLGIITGMMPLLVIFQIPAAQYVARVGYKRFVYGGWGIRVVFIFVMALVPLTYGFLDRTARLGLMLALLFGFNLSRGISSAGWLPWITALVPPNVRGRYLARDAAWINLASFGSFVVAALCLGIEPQPWQFAVIFLFSSLMGATSLVFLKRIPEGATPEQARASGTPVPWGELLRFEPFRRLLRVVVAWAVASGGITTFTVAFLKVRVGMPESAILLVNSIFFLGGLSSLWFLGSRLDHLGSKPILTFCCLIWIGIMAGWGLLAGNLVDPRLWIILLLQFAMGLFTALVNMSNTRLVMAIAPTMGRNHFFAIFSVLANVTLGVSPILWGLLIDAIGSRTASMGAFEWNRYAVFFVAVAAAFAITLGLTRQIAEPQAASLDELLREILIQQPQRVLRIWTRVGR